MLLLTRRVGEKLILSTDEGLKITIVIRPPCRGQVGIGIEAPPSVHVDREEIYNKKLASGCIKEAPVT